MTKKNQASPDKGVSRLPATVYLLTACIGVIGSNSLVLGPIAPEVARSLETSVPAVMAASSAFGLGTAASALFLARYIDRFGARRMLRLSMALLSAALLLCALAPVVHAMVAAQLAAGLASGIALPAIYASAAAVSETGREGRTIGVVLTGWTLSMVAGVSLSAVLADTIHWRFVYAAVGLLAALSVGALSLMMPLREQASRATAPLPLSAAALPGVKPLLVACCMFMAGFYGLYGYLGDHLTSGLGQPVSANGLAALVYGIGFGGSVALDPLIERIGPRRLMPIAFVAVAAVFLGFALLGHSFAAIVALMLFWGLANHLGLNLVVMRLTAIDPGQRGTIMGLNSAVTYLAVFLGTSGFGPLYSAWGFAACAVVAMALTLVAALAGSVVPDNGVLPDDQSPLDPSRRNLGKVG